MRRFAPLGLPFVTALAWILGLAIRPIPATIDSTIVVFVVVLGAGVVAIEAAPLISPSWREWGLGGGILGALLAPFGVSITILALFAYRAGDLGPGWEESWSVIPALVLQGIAVSMVITGLVLQRKDLSTKRQRRGVWIVILGTLAGWSAVAVHLCAVAFDAI